MDFIDPFRNLILRHPLRPEIILACFVNLTFPILLINAVFYYATYYRSLSSHFHHQTYSTASVEKVKLLW